MKLIWAIATVGLAAVGGFLWKVRAAPRATAHYTLDLAGAESGSVRVRLELAGLPDSRLALRGLLADRLMRMEDLAAEDGSGEALALVAEAADVPTGNIRSRLTTWRIDDAKGSDGGRDRIVLNYTLRPGSYKATNPCGEERHLGYVDGAGVSLSAVQMFLLADLPLAELGFDVRRPAGWSLVSSIPARMVAPRQEQLWDLHVAAGPLDASERCIGGGVRLHAAPGVTPDARAAVEAVIESIAERLGPSPSIDVVLLGRTRDGLRMQPVTSRECLVFDLDEPDVATLRELIRSIVPAWKQRRRAAVEEDVSADAWFALGLGEFWALDLPDRLGLANTPSRPSIEYTWVADRAMADVDPATTSDAPRPLTLRRVRAMTLIAELDKRLGAAGDWRALLSGWGGHGLPRLEASNPVAARWREFSSGPMVSHPLHLDFERNWRVELADRPVSDRGDAPVARRVGIAFTANADGHVENCGCKVNQDGGLARRAAAIRELRTQDPELLVLDLGNFFPIEKRAAKLDPLLVGEIPLYLNAMTRMGYDAAVAGANEMMAGPELFRSQVAALPWPVLANGLTHASSTLGQPSVVIERGGLRIGIVGHSQKHDVTWLRESQEREMVGVRFSGDARATIAVVRELRKQVDFLIVAGMVGPSELRELCASELGVDLILAGESQESLSNMPTGFFGDTAVAFDVARSYGLNHLELELDATNRVLRGAFRLVSLPRSAAVDPLVQGLLDAHYASLPAQAMEAKTRLFDWDDWARGRFVGADTCAGCHVAEHRQWLTTPHAGAMQTLRKVNRGLHPGCVPCHVVGYDREGGYDISAPQASLEGVQCETCHGSGAEHARAPSRANIRRSPDRNVCVECHNADHSDEFDARYPQALDAVRHIRREE